MRGREREGPTTVMERDGRLEDEGEKRERCCRRTVVEEGRSEGEVTP